MRALVTRGKFKGIIFDVSQWCSDWFTLTPTEGQCLLTEKECNDVIRKPFTPSSLAFTIDDYNKICEHDNNGMLFNWYEPVVTRKAHPTEPFVVIFNKRK